MRHDVWLLAVMCVWPATFIYLSSMSTSGHHPPFSPHISLLLVSLRRLLPTCTSYSHFMHTHTLHSGYTAIQSGPPLKKKRLQLPLKPVTYSKQQTATTNRKRGVGLTQHSPAQPRTPYPLVFQPDRLITPYCSLPALPHAISIKSSSPLQTRPEQAPRPQIETETETPPH